MLLDRRGFLKSLGIIGGGSIAGACGAPTEKLRAYLTAPREMVPGVANWYATVCRACPAGCGLMVRVREGRPVKLEGNPRHPVNRGALCARGQAAVQGLYGPARLRAPLVRKGDRQVEVSWDVALEIVSRQLKEASTTALLTGLERGSFDALVAKIAAGWSGLTHTMYEPVALRSLATASSALFGLDEVPRIDLSGADHVLSLGADFLDAWVSPVEFSGQWAERHGFTHDRALQLDYVGPRRNLTASAADRWDRFSSDQVGAVALGVVYGLIEVSRDHLTEEEARRYGALAAQLGPRPSFEGEQAKVIEREVKLLRRAKQGVVLFGGAEVLGEDATAVQAATLLSNHLLGSTGKNLRYREGYALSKLTPAAVVLSLLGEAGAGRVDALIVHGTDPAATLPGAASYLGTAPFVLALTHERSDTTDLAHVVLPVHHPLESWGDFEVARGVEGLMQPVRRPLHDTRHAADLLLELARRRGGSAPSGDFREFVAQRWSGKIAPELAKDSATDSSPKDHGWREMLVQGGRFYELSRDAGQELALQETVQLPPIAKPGELAPGSVRLLAPLSPLLHDGRGASQDLLLEVPDPLLQTAWDIPVEIPTSLAAENEIQNGDLVELRGAGGPVVARAFIDDELVPKTVALRFSGRRDAARDPLASGRVADLLNITFDPRSGELAMTATAVTLKRVGKGDLVRVSGGSDSEGRLLALSVSLDAAKRGRFPRLTRHGEQRPDERGEIHGHPVDMPHDEKDGERPVDSVVRRQEFPVHRWGLAIDLDRCTGCGACAVACYAENNIPVVGRDEVARGRELSWIRLERHDFNTDHGRRVRFLPVMCQQCDNAPCETVCPVFASYHTNDGLNGQVYNRCIGTRYCANNCPYKVRRFNYWDYGWAASEKQRLNPDVTVRSRGVMEKCTFCIQRIREKTNLAKAEGRALRDGEIVPACAQTCPTRAITFGDYKDPKSEVVTRSRDPRGYRLLDHLINTRPGVVYLRKVETSSEEA